MNPHCGMLPWLAEAWSGLIARLVMGRVPQALLIQGAAGLGKMRLAETLAQRLLCRQPGEFACGACSACHLFLAGTHPDFIKVEPAEPGKPISVDAVRHLIADLALKPQYGGFRVVIFAPAHQLNLNAANALLKTLEEPAEHTVMLLLTDSPAALPATILSRCQRLPIQVPAREPACRWLREQGVDGEPEALLAAAGGAPLKALALAGSDRVAQRRAVFGEFTGLLSGREEPLALAERWTRQAQEDIIEWLLSWSADLIRLASVPGGSVLYNPDLRADLQSLAGRLNLTDLFGVWSAMLKAKRALGGQANRQLLFEEFLIHWWRLRSHPEPVGNRHE